MNLDDDYDRRRADGYHARLSTACHSLGQIEVVLEHPEWLNRDAQLAEAAAELRVALIGTEEELAALNARRRTQMRELLGEQGTSTARHPAADVPHRRGCLLASNHRGECDVVRGEDRG